MERPALRRKTRALARRLIEAAWDGGDFAVCEAIVAEDAVDHNPFPGEPWGRVGIVAMLKDVHRAFDYNERVADLVAEGDKVALRRELTVHHRGRYFGIAPTGRVGQMTGMAVFKIRGGQVVERWGEFDILTMLHRMGIVPGVMLRGPLPGPAAHVATAIQQSRMRSRLH